MCELLGMSANVPTDICFSFTGLIKRGGETGPHTDGWGITFYEEKGSRTFKDPIASAHSKIAELVKNYPIKSKAVLCHIRRANVGKVSLANTQPYSRELWGLDWTFAHNGQLRGIKNKGLEYYQPIGSTDSEYAFCWIMCQLRKKFKTKPKGHKELKKYLHHLFLQLDKMGVANFLLTDSRYLFAYCSTKLHWVTRKAPFGKAKLIDADMMVNFKKETSPKDIVTVVATQPLTHNEMWNNFKPKEMVVFKEGKIC